MEAEANDLRRWADSVDESTVVLLGMGGSSLGPAVLSALCGTTGYGNGRKLVVCDTTDPETVDALPSSDTFYLVSSKSGTTLEPRALLAHAWSKVRKGSRYAAITDPGTALAHEAEERSFARTFANPADIGGRYSVLSYFGMVPAALLGYDPAELVSIAMAVDVEDAVELGRQMGEAAKEGRDKVTLVVPEDFRSFGLWAEQLIAESTGKQGTGCVPIPTTGQESGSDRFVLDVPLARAVDVAREFFRFELAVPIAGHVLGIDPFDEPNVAESKENTNKVLGDLPLAPLEKSDPEELMGWLEENVQPDDYVSLQAYLPFGQDDALEAARRRVRDHLGGLAVTAGYGPRFLHSTGQLHKGGPSSVIAVQVVPSGGWEHLDVPGFPYDFETLIAAQVMGDLESLHHHGRRALRVGVSDLSEIAR